MLAGQIGWPDMTVSSYYNYKLIDRLKLRSDHESLESLIRAVAGGCCHCGRI